MPSQTNAAITWAVTQTVTDDQGNTYLITNADRQGLVDKVREYFNTNSIAYSTFSYEDLVPFM